MKTLLLFLLSAVYLTACTHRLVEHVEVHDTLHRSISDTIRLLITLTDSVFIHDITSVENDLSVRARLIYHRQLTDRASQHLHQSQRAHARRKETQRSAVRSVSFPLAVATKSWQCLVFGMVVGIGVGKLVWKH